MEDVIGAFIGLVAVGMPIWIVWIVMHYRSKGRQEGTLSEEEHRQLTELNDLAEKMAERIKNLETILDAEAPHWRDYDSGETEPRNRSDYDDETQA